MQITNFSQYKYVNMKHEFFSIIFLVVFLLFDIIIMIVLYVCMYVSVILANNSSW